MKVKISTISICALLLCAIVLNLSGCAIKIIAADLMEGITAQSVTERSADEGFVSSQMELAIKLFKASANESGKENLLISPLSIQLALAMTANGADGETRAEMERLLGGDIPLDTLNEYLHTYISSLPSDEKYKVNIANSIWFRNRSFTPNRDFLQLNANYYGANAYGSDFDGETVKDINNWVNKETYGTIKKLIDDIDAGAVMYLINAVAFDARWADPYSKEAVVSGIFTNANGEKQEAMMMHSDESRYISTEDAVGFFKNYAGGKYSFVALLPNEGITIDEYIASLDAGKLLSALNGASYASVIATMPKFSYEYSLTMNDCLASLGMPTAFDGTKADFSKLGTSEAGNMFISQVLHKTFISVDELGTKAGAVTSVQVSETSAQKYVKVTLDRPFVYMIVDNSTNLPIFIGALTDVQ